MQLKRAALIVSTAASFLTPFMSSSVTIALPDISREFSMSAVSLSWVATSYLLAAAAFLLPFGRLADIRGRKRMFVTGMALHTVASICTAAAPSGALLIAFRAAQGVGGAMIFGTAVAILVSVTPPPERGRVLGINVAAVYLGLSLGPFLGGLMTHEFGWRSLFAAAAALGAVVMAVTLRTIPMEWADARGERFDLAGAASYTASLTAVMVGFTLLPGTAGAVLLAAGVIGLAAFVRRESGATHPLLDVMLLKKNPVFAFSNLAAFINYSATYGVTFLLSLYLQYVKGLTPQAAGSVLIVQPVLMTVLSPVAGRMSDRIEPRIVASVGMGIMVAGLAFCAVLDGDSSLPAVMLPLMLLGIGFALFSSPNTNAVMSSVDRGFYSVASATLSTMRLTGQMLSMGVVILIFATNIGRARITPDRFPLFLGGMRLSFVIFTILSACGVFASLVRGNVRQDT